MTFRLDCSRTPPRELVGHQTDFHRWLPLRWTATGDLKMPSQITAPGGSAAPPGGVPDAFADQVLAHSQSLRVLARYLCRDRAEAEDLHQEVLLRAFRYRHQFMAGSNLKAWLRAIMRNTHALRGRRSRRQAEYDPQLAERLLATETDPTIPMELDDVRRALTFLPVRCREVLILAAGGSSYDEMSYVLGCPVGTVKSRLSRARDLLQAVLAEGDFRALEHSRDPLGDLESQFAALTPKSR